ncbi:UNVERIFIED_CONTAM: protein STICHEL [Sesamum radiatum]|uniref:Protein STICHEL n=1 Tax=Sesamum radiatum TaxID=300843 RepID=A0AAW2U6X5_SESRA
MQLENKSTRLNIAIGNSDLNFHQEPLKLSTGSFNIYGSHQMKPFDSVTGNATMSASKESKSGIPVKRIESIIHEQRLETAWLQAMEKGTPGSMSRLKPERNQVLPQDGTCPPNQLEAMNSADVSVQHWEDELNHEIKALKISDGVAPQKDQIGRRIEHYAISPSLLHNSSFASNFSKENIYHDMAVDHLVNTESLERDTSLDRRLEAAAGCSVGTTLDLKDGERLNKALLCVRAEADGSRGSESVQNQGQTADTTDDRKGHQVLEFQTVLDLTLTRKYFYVLVGLSKVSLLVL